jgi:hypothetical protein
MSFFTTKQGKFRNEILAISLASTLVCLTVLIFFFSFVEVAYLLKLAFWFLFAISLFHLIFSSYNNLRAVHIKAIDFPYLAIVAAGIFVLTIHSSEQREAYLDKYNDFFLRQIERSHIEQLRPALRAYKQSACVNAEDIPLLGLHCKFAEEVDKIVSESTPLSDRLEILSRVEVLFQRISAEEGRRISGAFEILAQLEGKTPSEQKELRDKYDEFRRATTLGTYEQVLAHFKIIARDIRARVDEARRTRVDDGILRLLFELGYTAVWPFVFLLALALRLTKVTMEVLAWGRP